MEHEPLVWKTWRDSVDRDTIAVVERKFGVKFPEDYIECAMRYHGGYPNHHAFDFEGHEGMVFGRLLSFTPDDSEYILDTYHNVRDRLADHVYPFASDSFGNLICFDYRQNRDHSPTIVFWDHELAFLNKEKGLLPICNTFTELVSKIRPSRR